MNFNEYKTVSAISSKELDHAVNRQIKSGFQPYGSPYVVGTGSGQSIYQALVKSEGVVIEESPVVDNRIPQLPAEGKGGLSVAR